MNHFWHELAGLGAGLSIWGAITTHEALALGGLAISLLALAGNALLEWRRKNTIETLTEALAHAVVAAKIKAIEAHEPDPYPQCFPLASLNAPSNPSVPAAPSPNAEPTH
jgi:hypothetical protein